MINWLTNTYWPEVRGNVYAIVPCGIAAFFWFRSKHLAILASHEALKVAHVEHSEKLDSLLDSMDPDSDGGMQTVLDRLDPESDGGIKVLRDDIAKLRKVK